MLSLTFAYLYANAECSLTYRQVIFLETNISAAAGVVVVHTVGLREHNYY